MDVKSLLLQYRDGQRKFVLINLRGAPLAGVNLSGANLSRANLTEADLSGADLSQTTLVKANLTRANLRRANLAGADLRWANLTGAEVDLTGLAPENYWGAILPDGTVHTPEVAEAEAIPEASTSADMLSEGLPTHTPLPIHDLRSTIPPVSQRSSLAVAAPAPAAGIPRSEWRMPWLGLSFWSMGYGFLGLFLYLQRASIGGWLLVGLTALLALGRLPYRWLAPVIAAISVIVGTALSGTAVITGALVTLGVTLGMKLTGWAWSPALGLGSSVGAIGCILLAITPLFLAQGGTGMGVARTLPMGLIFLFGMVLIGLGVSTQQQLSQRFQPSLRLALMASSAVAGLGLGGLMGWVTLLNTR